MRSIDWTSYANVYDLMAASNPAYRAIVATLERELAAWRVDSGAKLLDLGSGTGNFSVPLARAFGGHRVLCVDSDPAMNEEARRKADGLGLRNMETVEADIERVDFAPGTLAAIVCVHALYTLDDPASVIRRMYAWTSPGGYVFVCDLGRVLALGDWSAYLFKELTRRHGLIGALSVFRRGAQVMKQNRRIVQAQKSHRFWTHSHAEFRAAFEEAGFDVLRSTVCYRGYSDLVIARKRRPEPIH